MNLDIAASLAKAAGGLLAGNIAFLVWIGTRHHLLSTDSSKNAKEFEDKLRAHSVDMDECHQSYWREIVIFYQRYQCNLKGLQLMGLAAALTTICLVAFTVLSVDLSLYWSFGALPILVIAGYTLYGDLYQAGKQHPIHLRRLYDHVYKPYLESKGIELEEEDEIDGVTRNRDEQ
ncbi:MAG: hypothetical protein CMJ48_10245 [Planctomycetaceae bacterium]|nr:hypothetical protein [Planctomycetaceae bacterium]